MSLDAINEVLMKKFRTLFYIILSPNNELLDTKVHHLFQNKLKNVTITHKKIEKPEPID